jgi:hypothetical protein
LEFLVQDLTSKKISGIKNNQGELFLIVREIPTCPPGRVVFLNYLPGVFV